MADPRRIHVGGRQGRGDPFATWREEDEAKDGAARRVAAWYVVLYLLALVTAGAVYLST